MAAGMIYRSASKTASDGADSTDESTACGGCSTTGLLPPYSDEASDSTESTPLSSWHYLPRGVVVRNTFIDYIDDEGERGRIRTRRRTRSTPPALAAARDQRTNTNTGGLDAAATGELSASQGSLATSGSSCMVQANMQVPRGAVVAQKLIDAASRNRCAVAKMAPWPSDDCATPADLPSRGSMEHYTGRCRPCTFFWKPQGCASASECEFCHLCDSDEKKRRQRNRKLLRKAHTLGHLIQSMAVNDENDDEP
eukprot:TRINITY_DN36930_c0_g2_i1.p1 TRINITY_DN36930_c0_g2~~TRINITY_DN36930_c0_g2_i1.p1  ORF type:complete len:253 (-),score=24.96 TRINITY_DN36930_c0_g2_i1:484-1242(-)